MNPSPDTIGASSTEASGAGRLPPPPTNWRKALMALIASRVDLIELEAKDLGKAAVRRGILFGAAFLCILSTWALVLVGGIALIADVANCPWSWVALSAAALHLLIAFILVRMAKPSGGRTFPVTRSEFKKDREWIENLHKTKNSNG